MTCTILAWPRASQAGLPAHDLGCPCLSEPEYAATRHGVERPVLAYGDLSYPALRKGGATPAGTGARVGRRANPPLGHRHTGGALDGRSPYRGRRMRYDDHKTLSHTRCFSGAEAGAERQHRWPCGGDAGLALAPNCPNSPITLPPAMRRPLPTTEDGNGDRHPCGHARAWDICGDEGEPDEAGRSAWADMAPVARNDKELLGKSRNDGAPGQAAANSPPAPPNHAVHRAGGLPGPNDRRKAPVPSILAASGARHGAAELHAAVRTPAGGRWRRRGGTAAAAGVGVRRRPPKWAAAVTAAVAAVECTDAPEDGGDSRRNAGRQVARPASLSTGRARVAAKLWGKRQNG